MIRQPGTLRRQGKKHMPDGRGFLPVSLLLQKHRLWPCLDSTCQEAWTRGCIAAAAAAGTVSVPRHRQGRSKDHLHKSRQALFSARSCVLPPTPASRPCPLVQSSCQAALSEALVSPPPPLPPRLRRGSFQVGAFVGAGLEDPGPETPWL